MAICETCLHREVCGKYKATGGVNKCRDHKDERHGKWVAYREIFPKRRMVDILFLFDMRKKAFCSYCGAYRCKEDYCSNCGALMDGGNMNA